MTALPRVLCAWVALSLALLGMLAWGQAQGFVSARVVMLWARALLVFDGPEAFRATNAFLPPIPDLLTLLVQGIVRSTAVPAPFPVAAGLGALLVLRWHRAFRDEGGYAGSAALLVTALLALNPFFLRAVADGPGTVLLLIGLWTYARGLVSLRRSGSAPDMMKVALGLLIAVLSHPFGLLVCLAALPCILVAARPSVLAASPGGYVVAMAFPIIAAVGGLLFVNVIFDRALPPLPLPDPLHVRPHGAHLLALAGMAPILAMVVVRTIRKAPHFVPMLAALGTVLGACALNVFYPAEPDPAIAAAATLPVVAAAARYWPAAAPRVPAVAALLALGAALSAVSIPAGGRGETARWIAAVTLRAPAAGVPVREVATFLRGKDGIMLDAERNPGIVTALGGADTLLLAGQPGYDIAMQGGRVGAAFIVVPRAARGAGAPDRVLGRFPQLSNDTLAGFSRVYQDAGWQVFGRTGS